MSKTTPFQHDLSSTQALMIAQKLLVLLGKRIKLARVVTLGESVWAFTVQGRGYGGGRIVLPVITGIDQVRVLSVLDTTGNPDNARWLFNGQASRGCNTIAHFGDQGACVINFSRDQVADFYGSDLNHPAAIVSRETVEKAPDKTSLTVYLNGFETAPQIHTFPAGWDHDHLAFALRHNAVLARPGDDDLIQNIGLGLRRGGGDKHDTIAPPDFWKHYASTSRTRTVAA